MNVSNVIKDLSGDGYAVVGERLDYLQRLPDLSRHEFAGFVKLVRGV